jgi:DAK2 domain fusion protein YloV
MLAAMSHGALMGARGNSGVILSQIVSGLAKSVDGAEELDTALLIAGLAGASTAAYKAVTTPTEGTILTVIREVSEAVAGDGAGDVSAILSTAVETAKESVERTPTLLPVLAEAGVVDAGGLGLMVLLEGMLRHIRGEPTDRAADVSKGAVEQQWLAMTEERHATGESRYGYCTEVLIGGAGLEVEPVRTKIEAMGDSVIVVGDETLVRVHVHTDDPGAVLTLGTGIGSLVQVKVDNISHQAERFVQMHEQQIAAPQVPAPAGALTCVAVASGEGVAMVFRSLDATRVVSGGPTMNPSTEEIVAAIEACGTNDVVVLPNDKNIILAAQQAVALTKKQARVVPSRSVPQGIAAVLAVNPDDAFDENVRAMEDAIARVRTIEITRAVRSTSIAGVKVEEGQSIAIVDDALKLAAASPEEAAMRALKDVVGDESSLITMYYGGDTDEATATRLGYTIREEFHDHEVEVVFGGQPHYDYIISVE